MKEEKIYSININNQIINDLSLDDLEQMLIKGQINFETIAWKPGMKEWLSLYALYLDNKVELLPELKKKYFIQKIINYLNAIELSFQFAEDTAFDEKMTIENCEDGKKRIKEVVVMLRDLELEQYRK